MNYHKILTNLVKIKLVSFVRLFIYCEGKFNYVLFIFPDAANIFSNNINISHENFQMNEVKNKSDEFNFAEKITKLADNNSRRDKIASKSKK